MNKLIIKPFFDEVTCTVTYVLTDKATSQTAVIDPVLDYDANSGKLSSTSIDAVIDHIDSNNLRLEWILETHAHADHVSAAAYLKNKRGGQIGIGEHIKTVQSTFKAAFNFGSEMHCDGRQFDYLFEDGELLTLGHLAIEVKHTPGHTPACASYLIEDAVFVGDTIFMPDFGTARTDFPNGSAKALYQSIQKLLALPEHTRMFVGHDYKSPTRDVYAWETTVLEQKRNNIHVKTGSNENDFIKMRNTRDATLPVPKLLLPAIQLNIRSGQLPPQESNGQSYLKIPLTVSFSQ
ncbi:MBL fold metallo-hydrolase [Glaciecola sp. SC05]|uniref:MBL fold metallo-hydrolase n=1 Tax=Glaciecola sp. SC05 TaxID=1987355 RepID=UPI0035293EAA